MNEVKEIFQGFEDEELTNVVSDNSLPHNYKDLENLDVRNQQYSELLKIYIDYTKTTLERNISNKDKIIKAFIGCLVVMVVLFCAASYIILKGGLSVNESAFAIVTSVISLISAFIVIPAKITEYTFNPNEMSQISEVVKNIQEYDKAVREDISKSKKQ